MPGRRPPPAVSAYGLGIRVNRAIAALQNLPAPSQVDVEVSVDGMPPWLPDMSGQPPSYVSPYSDDLGRPGVQMWRVGGYARLLFVDGAEFLVDRSGGHVWAACPETSTLDDTASYLLGPIMGFVLRLRGVICLHASAVSIGGFAVAFIGPSGAGKSTTAAALAWRGSPVLSDEIVPLSVGDESCLAQPAYPRLRLWPASLDVLLQAGSLPSHLAPTTRHRRHHLDLTANGYRFQREPLPLAAVYLLTGRPADRGAPHVEAVPVAAGFRALLANTYATSLLDRDQRAQEFHDLGRVATSIPVRRVYRHLEPAHLSGFCDLIEEDVETLTAGRLQEAAVEPRA
jgi:hypothetical protein